ncbi:iron-sulfur protein [Candidatus Epulonipiscium fishelsonii]|uniref:Iron-sulfur protein n=1 Tax=Candidatus Epulonipiscium fishelsonii TaxID=77094 RepID=A0ACC8XEB5_9FIRM|nr:iron-sulfur protein [Epulopiscium sp. SCG-B11WGA-EpuloA1]ONI43955.1 iron-sulfur protein [Epulopiscium sp. SCG-B05WGA-EpuloA1]
MNILILNGSPKGKNSVTLQTALYLSKRFPKHNFDILNVAQQIKQIERNFNEAKEKLEKAELIIFVYPIYTYLVPYQLQRFIEVMKENEVNLVGKFATQITTSKHFYDFTAHKYIEQNCFDCGLNYIKGLSADMDDLQTTAGRYQADCFFEKVMFDMSHKIYKAHNISFQENILVRKQIYKPTLFSREKRQDKDVVLVTNVAPDDINLKNMIQEVKSISLYPIREINIREYPFIGGCIGCMNCTITEKCIYKDNFDEFLRAQIQSADAILYAFTIENHYTHSSFKCYEDRQFCNGHRTVTQGKITGYIISGNYSEEHNIQTLVEARSEVAGMYLCGVASDENNTKKSIIDFVNSLTYSLKHNMQSPRNFYGVGGNKIFRDLVFQMQGIMQADHKFYKQTGAYDFPHKKLGLLLGMKALGIIMKNDKVQKQMSSKMSEYILEPYTKILEQTKQK